MGLEGLFKGAFPALEKALDLRAMKHELIVSNIANKDTPNFKAFDLIVEEEMARSEAGSDPGRLRRTHEGHLPGKGSVGISTRIRDARGEERALRGDGNSVDIDREMAKLSENNLLYDALAQIISRKFDGLENVIKGGT
ncbi:MAG: flagellar basal body rod protein FlgB [Deltaproteobacteria bacterium]|nr:flagellar basal body rod protein FlgB [Deltaproteobacteria bacterium]